jgi:hypothetical protein
VQTLAEMGQEHDRVTQIGTVNVDLSGDGSTQTVSLAEATISPDGQIILTGEDGTQSSKSYTKEGYDLQIIIDICLRVNSISSLRNGYNSGVYVSDRSDKHSESD